MPVVPAALAATIAQEWLEAFNAHRADRVVEHFSDDVTACSAVIAQLRPGSGGRLRGKAAILSYYEDGLRLLPNLHFTLVEVLTGVDQLTVVYRNQDGTLVAETLKLGRDGRVDEVAVTYAVPPATG